MNGRRNGHLLGMSSSMTAPDLAATDPAPGTLVRAALDQPPSGRRERSLVLLDLYDLALAPVGEVGASARLLTDPRVTALKTGLEDAWLAQLDTTPAPADLPVAPAEALRSLATRDRLPQVYRWLAREADDQQIRQFLALEGGPDGGFDDLVALCQVGISGRPKMEMARNYWDEMGNGSAADVHTTLHQDMAAALDLPRIPRTQLPIEALERSALGGLLATNRWLQPEMIGALGLIELQAGPRCTLVLQALRRVGAPSAAVPFYQVHADVDPRHGKDWLDEVVGPWCDPAGPHAQLASRVVRGAWWRWTTNQAFFARMRDKLVADEPLEIPVAA
jgi:hypothetical protein